MVWIDAKEPNVAFALEDNKPSYIDGEQEIEVEPETVGFKVELKTKGQMEEGYLKKGQIVIIDLDYVFEEKDPILQQGILSGLAEKFEDRYQEEIKGGLDK